jgi:peptidoglycan/LPS O-acetylase OafA/YrhL
MVTMMENVEVSANDVQRQERWKLARKRSSRRALWWLLAIFYCGFVLPSVSLGDVPWPGIPTSLAAVLVGSAVVWLATRKHTSAKRRTIVRGATVAVFSGIAVFGLFIYHRISYDPITTWGSFVTPIVVAISLLCVGYNLALARRLRAKAVDESDRYEAEMARLIAIAVLLIFPTPCAFMLL